LSKQAFFARFSNARLLVRVFQKAYPQKIGKKRKAALKAAENKASCGAYRVRRKSP